MMAATIIGWTGLTTHAQPLDLPLSVWERFFTVSAGFGYKDNPTLSHSAREPSAFFAGNLELFAVRLPSNGRQYSLFLTADDRRYFSSESVDKEQLVIAQAEFKQVFDDAGEVSISAEYDYQDQIADVSVTETNLEAIRVRGHTLAGHITARLNFPNQIWGLVELTPNRQWYAQPLDDYLEFGCAAVLGRDYGNRSDVSFRYQPGFRDYDNEVKLTASGEPVPGTHRSFNQQEFRLMWRHHWDEKRHWRTTSRAGYKTNTDNGSGYFDYTRLSAAQQVRYQTDAWHFSVEARFAYYDYAVQTASPSNDLRERTEFNVGLRAERQLSKAIRLVVAYDHERTHSNLDLEQYFANTVTGSVQWEF